MTEFTGAFFSSTNESEDPIAVEFRRPRMSIHKLSQYVEAKPSVRANLVSGSKRPSSLRADYKLARRLIQHALRLGWDDMRLGLETVSHSWLTDSMPWREFRQRSLSLDALWEYVVMHEDFVRDVMPPETRFRIPNPDLPTLSVGCTEIVVQPDAIAVQGEGEDERIGFVSFYFNRSRPHTEESATMAAALLKEFADAQLAGRAKVDRELCVVIDVFSGLAAKAPKSSKRKLHQLSIAADEVASLWPTV